MRSILRPLAINSAYSPIETIVFCAFVGTLAYFHILAVLRSSSSVALADPVGHLAWSPQHSRWLEVDASVYSAAKALKLEVVPTVGEAVNPSEILSTASYTVLPYSNISFSRDFGLGLPALLTQTFNSVLALIRQTPTPDILLILVGYLLMHYAFVLLYLRSRALGSSLWLPVTIINQGVLALFLTIPVTLWLGLLNFNPVGGDNGSKGVGIGVRELSEALPFLVCTIGFDKPMRLAKAVFTHPYMLSPCPTTVDPSSPHAALQTRYPGILPPAGELILSALSTSYGPIIRDYGLEIIVLVLGYITRIPGLREVCGVGAVLLSIDCVLMCTLLSSCFVVMVEVRRINVSSKTLRSSSTSSTPIHSRSRSSSISSNTATPEKEAGLWRRTKDSLLGPKGSALQLNTVVPSNTKLDSQAPTNPLTRLKLLLIATFLGLHFLELVAPLTLTPSGSYRGLGFLHERHHTPAKLRNRIGRLTEETGFDSMDPNSGKLGQVLEKVVSRYDGKDDIFVRVHSSIISSAVVAQTPDIYSILAAPTSSASSSSKAAGIQLYQTWRNWNLNWNMNWDWEFDSLLARWVLVLLGVSLGLNGILLRGIGAQSSSSPLASDAFAQVLPSATVIKEMPAPVIVPTLAAVTPPVKQKPKTLSLKQEVLKQESIQASASASSSATGDLVSQSDASLIALVKAGKLPSYALEKSLGGLDLSKSKAERNELLERAVRIRRGVLLPTLEDYEDDGVLSVPSPQSIPHSNFDYTPIPGACCENVIGYIPLPLGLAGPLIIDGRSTPIPMATAEGTLVASTSRGCKALNASGGVTTVVVRDGMSRGPACEFPSLLQAAEAVRWVETPDGYAEVKAVFESTSRFAKLKGLKPALSGRIVYLRFTTTTGDAMGMNMISKACEAALTFLMKRYAGMRVLALSGNYCTDKKAAMINWIEGRGKSVVAEAVLPASVVKSVLKTSVSRLVEVNTKKNLVGSAMAGAAGPGSNAHAANIVTAIFLATGQDPAQNVESSSCLTWMEQTPQGDLLLSVTMPSIEVGTVGGGTILTPQASVLSLLGVRGAHQAEPGHNAGMLARIVAAGVMAGELSLLSALTEGELVKAHMVHNRSAVPTPVPGTPIGPGALSRVPSSLSMSTLTR